MAKAIEFNVFGQIIPIIKKMNLKKMAHEYGHYNPETKEITIDSKLNEKDLVTTLMHEVIHAVHDRLNIQINPAIEEMLSEVITIALYDNFKITMKD